MNTPSARERARRSLPYALLILVGLICIVSIALFNVGRQDSGWLFGADLNSTLRADYNITPEFTLQAVDPTRLAELKATDEAALTQTPGVVATVPVGRITPGSTIIARVTETPTRTPTPTLVPSLTPTPSPSPTATRTPTLTPILPTPTPSETPITPTPTSTFAPATNTPTSSPTPSPTNTVSPPSNTPTPTSTGTPTDTPTATTNPRPPAPLSLTVVNTNTTQLSLVWSNESQADADFVQYRVYSSTLSGGPYISIGTTALTSFVASNLTMGTPYYFIVRGEDTIQQSINSPEANGIPSGVTNPNPIPTNCGVPIPPINCADVGLPPNGIITTVYSTQTLTLDFGARNGLLNGPGWDLVYYEKETPPAGSNLIQVQYITIELSMDGSAWYVAYAWSINNESLAQNSNIAPFAINSGVNPDPGICDFAAGASEIDVIQMVGTAACPSWQAVPEGGLYGTLPYKTGIAIDLAGVPPPVGEGYRYIRIGQRPDAIDPAEIDSIQRLN